MFQYRTAFSACANALTEHAVAIRQSAKRGIFIVGTSVEKPTGEHGTGLLPATAKHAAGARIEKLDGAGCRKTRVSRTHEPRLEMSYFNASTSAPAAINPAPITVFTVSASPRKSAANPITNTTLSLSIGATFEASPSCKARK